MTKNDTKTFSKSAEILLYKKCVEFNLKKKFKLTSGKTSPVYCDCRKLISFPKEREIVINEMAKLIKSKYKNKVLVAGGETAGIPYSSFISHKFKYPMVYIRKQPKGFGKGKLIEGEFKKKSTSILIEETTITKVEPSTTAIATEPKTQKIDPRMKHQKMYEHLIEI